MKSAHESAGTSSLCVEHTAFKTRQTKSAYHYIKPLLPDVVVTSLSYARTFGKLRAFRQPKSFNERLLHKKLHDRSPLLVRTTDKFLVRNYVASKIGEEHLVPMLLVTDDPRKIDFSALPRSFIIKATHGSGWVVVVKDKDAADRQVIVDITTQWLRTNYYDFNREWALKMVEPRLIVEELLSDNGAVPDDYKFFVFRGHVGLIEFESGRFVDYRENYFDRYWHELAVATRYRRRETPIPRPANLARMIELSQRLAADFEVARIDLYTLRDRIYFGEITHYPGQGMYRWRPPSFDDALGKLWAENAPIPSEYYLGSG